MNNNNMEINVKVNNNTKFYSFYHIWNHDIIISFQRLEVVFSTTSWN